VNSVKKKVRRRIVKETGASRASKLPDSPVERWAFTSKDLETKVLNELNLEDAQLRDQAAHSIAIAIVEYRIRAVNDLHHVSDASEIARAKRAMKALKTSVEALQELGRDSALMHFMPALNDLEFPRTREEFYEDLNVVADCLGDYLKSTKPKRGREPLDTLDDFISELTHIYRDTTRREPGFSSKPSNKPGSKAKAMHGPFVRFCQDVVSEVTPDAVGSVFDSVRRVLRGKRPESRSKNWP
jgi:hypothetical protein